MISLTLIFCYACFLFFGAGLLVYILFIKIGILPKGFSGLGPDYFLLLGLVSITTILAVYSIFLPIDLYLNLALFSIIYTLIIFHRETVTDIFASYYSAVKEHKNMFLTAFLAFTPLIIATFIFSLSEIQSFDTGLYHAQFIQWMEKHKTVPGLAWIHTRFAFNSHFHLLSALFSFSSLDLKNSSLTPLVFYPLNSFFFLMFAFRSIVKIAQGLRSRSLFIAVQYAALLFCSFALFGSKLQSPIPDSIVCILTLYVFLYFLEKFEYSRSWTPHQLIILLLVLILPTFKLSAGLIVLMILPLMWTKSLKQLVTIGVLAAIITIPYFVRNTIISGYPLYAIPSLDLVDVNWKIPAENALMENDIIKAWARIPYRNYQEVLALPLKEWLPQWWEIYAYDLIKHILEVSLISPLILLLVFLFRRKERFNKIAIIFGVLIVNLVFWFLSAPDPRFAWGFLLIMYALTLASLAKLLTFHRSEYLIGVGIFFFMYKSLWYTSNDWHQLLSKDSLAEIRYYPKQIPRASVKLFDAGTFPLWTPTRDDGRCYNAAVPCSPAPLSKVRMRGKDLDAGFFYDTKMP